VHHHARLELAKCALHHRKVGDGPFDHAQPFDLGEQFAFAGGEIVQREQLVAARQPVLYQIGAEASGAARDQDAHA
jgi:hypothetical protein